MKKGDVKMKNYDIDEIESIINKTIKFSENVTILRRKILAKEITLREAREELTKDNAFTFDNTAFNEDGTVCYPYLLGRVEGALKGIKQRIEFMKER